MPFTAAKSVITNKPTFIEASLWRHPSVINDLFEVLISPVVEETDECYQPVLDFLSVHCTREVDWDREDSDDFFFGECIRTEYRVYAVCPGGSIEHNCACVRTERVEEGRGGEFIGG